MVSDEVGYKSDELSVTLSDCRGIFVLGTLKLMSVCGLDRSFCIKEVSVLGIWHWFEHLPVEIGVRLDKSYCIFICITQIIALVQHFNHEVLVRCACT